MGSNDLDESLVSKKIELKMACGAGAQLQVNLVKKAKTRPDFDATHRKPRIENENIFFKT